MVEYADTSEPEVVCVPECPDLYCGDDGCDGLCACSGDGRCFDSACIPVLGISTLQTDPSSADCVDQAPSVPTQGEVVVRGVVTTPTHASSSTFDATYLSEAAGGSWSGLRLTWHRDAGLSFTEGDEVEVHGEVVEHYCNTELQAESVVVLSSGHAVTPAEVATSTLAAAEAWEGAIVVSAGPADVTAVDALAQYGEFTVSGGLVVDRDDLAPTLSPVLGGRFEVLAGVMKYTFGAYKLAAFPCAPVCGGRVCGDDACGASCGPCISPRVCDVGAGVCVLGTARWDDADTLWDTAVWGP